MRSSKSLVSFVLMLLFASCASEKQYVLNGPTLEWSKKYVHSAAPQAAKGSDEGVGPMSSQILLDGSVEMGTRDSRTAEVSRDNSEEVFASTDAVEPSRKSHLTNRVFDESSDGVSGFGSRTIMESQDNKKFDGSSSSPAKEKDQTVALILCIFVGILGIHRFYLGYTGIGIVQLLTLGGCGIWALIDLIRIITGDLKPKDGEYGEKGRL